MPEANDPYNHFPKFEENSSDGPIDRRTETHNIRFGRIMCNMNFVDLTKIVITLNAAFYSHVDHNYTSNSGAWQQAK